MSTQSAIPSAIYVRISSDSEGAGLGVRRQRADCEALAARLGWDVLDVYEDNDVSATSGRPRPAYERMMQAVGAGRVRGVVVWDVDRLTRTPRELEDVIDYADRMGLQLASVGGDIDLGTEQGRMMARMKGTVARYEVEQSSRRLRSKHAQMAAEGRHNGPRPFGWDLVTVSAGERATTELRVNEAEATVVRECVSRILAGEALWKMRNDLNRRGISTSTGGEWQTQTLRRMLLRWRNCGLRTHRGKVAGAGQWAPIIDQETHERVVATLTDPARRTNNRGTAVRYLLTGKAMCGACDRPMVGKAAHTYDVKVPPRKGETEPRRRTRKYPRSYICHHAGCMKVTRRMDDLDAYVEEVVLRLLERDGVQVLGGDPLTADAARDRIAALEAKLALTADQFAEDVITADQLARITGRLRTELRAEKARFAQAAPMDELQAFAGPGVREAWVGADVETRRNLIDVLGMRVVVLPVGAGNAHRVGPDTLRIEWTAGRD